MAICRSCRARETWVTEYYNHLAPLALRSDDADSNDLLFAQPSYKWLYDAAPELAMNIITKTINIRLLRSRSDTVDYNQL
jgi:hypothetical protein